MSLQIKKWLSLLFLVAFGGYHVACGLQYRDFMANMRPSRLVGQNVFWMARWKMFTGLSTYHSVPEFQGRKFDFAQEEMSQWTPLPMAEWYPARWESGYRWERPAVYTRRNVRARFLKLACDRSGSDHVRLVKHRWKATLGQREQPRKKYRMDILGGMNCSIELPPHKGIRL